MSANDGRGAATLKGLRLSVSDTSRLRVRVTPAEVAAAAQWVTTCGEQAGGAGRRDASLSAGHGSPAFQCPVHLAFSESVEGIIISVSHFTSVFNVLTSH